MTVSTEIHHPTATDVCTACGQHPDARIHHTPERLAGKYGPAVGEIMLRDPIEEGANLLAAAITPSGHGWAYAARFTKEALRDLVAAGWTPPAREVSDEESKLRARLDAEIGRRAQDAQDLDRVQAEVFALSALRDQLVHDVHSLSGRNSVAAALVKADAKERFTRQEVADLLRKILDRCDRAKDSAARQWEGQRAEWETTTQRKMAALAERFEQGELFGAVRHATARLLRVADTARRPDPVLRADGRTSVADARAALCLAQGVPLGEIDPASGHDLSRRAYESVRASWRRQAAMHGFSEQYDRPRLESAVAWWTARRPEFTAGDDWLAGLAKPADTIGAA